MTKQTASERDVAEVIDVLLLLGVVLWQALKPATADQLYDRIVAQVDDADLDKLFKTEKQMKAALDKFPGHAQAERVEAWLEVVEMTKLHRKLQRRNRVDLSLVEEAYLDAMSLENATPDEAVVRLLALVDLIGEQANVSDGDRLCIELARRQGERLAASQAIKHAKHVKALNAQLDRAEQLKLSDPERAAKIYRGIVQFYGDKPWASEVVKRAKLGLEQSPVR